MRNTLLFLASALALSGAVLTTSPLALAQQAPGVVSSGGLEAAPGLLPVRAELDADYGRAPSARRAALVRFFERTATKEWQILWDRDTDAPVRIFGKGVAAPGTVGRAKVAEAHARAFLAEHADLLAPGVAPAHLVLVANDLDAGLRTVAFEQYAAVPGHADPVPVIGGRVSFRYKNDRLFVLASEALPAAPLARPQIDAPAAEAAALAWVLELHGVATLTAAPDLVAIPLLGSGRREVRSAYRVMLDATSPRGRYAVYIDARTGAPLAREQLLRFSEAEVLFDVPIRAPQLGRTHLPAHHLGIQVDGSNAATDETGGFSWSGAGVAASVQVSATGPKVNVVSQAPNSQATATLMADDGGQLLWSLADDEFGDAQLSSFIHASIVQTHAHGIAPSMAFTTKQLTVKPNEADDQGCNAFWDGYSVNFYRENQACNNTARLADVVYHEFGHGFHQHSIILGSGAMDPSLGEAAGDTMGASVTHDSHLAPGFFLFDPSAPLRELDNNRHWPEDINWDPHETGLIWGGAMWKLRTYLVEDFGPDQGHALTDNLFYQALRRSSNILASYAEILAADDDDGDISNGTPHVCQINRAFVAHGIAAVLNDAGLVVSHEPLTRLPSKQASYPIKVTSKVLYPQCGAAAPIDDVKIAYHVPNGPPFTLHLDKQGDDYVGEIPGLKDGTQLRYTVHTSVGGFETLLPDNPADDEYRAFIGTTKELYCNDFEAQTDNWVFGDDKGASGDFQWNHPTGHSGDPASAFSGMKVIGNRLNGDGAYKPNRISFADSPVIDLQGEKHVRLQFRRWLAVEDGAFDQATVYVNGKPVWWNASTDEHDGSLHHKDLEWRFVDIDIASVLAPNATTAQVRFELQSDDGMQLGGWTIDDFCVVAYDKKSPNFDLDLGGDDPDTLGPPLDPGGGCACDLAGGRDAPLGAPLAAAAAALGLALARRRRRA